MGMHTRVAIIGGGVTGCSILYHLAKVGWSDVTLIERSELTSGSSWHAAGNLFTLTVPSNAQRLQLYSIKQYETMAEISGQEISYHPCGGLHLAADREEVEVLSILRAQGRRNGVDTDWMDLAEAKRMAPILDVSGLQAVLWEPGKGYVDPSSVTMAFAAAARNLGATILRHRPVTATVSLPDGRWRLDTPEGPITADYIVNAAGLWAREVAALAGISLPLLPVEHQYLVTEAIPEIEAMGHELPTISDSTIGFYSRKEGNGLLLGAYEKQCVHWAVGGTPLDFGHELLPDDLSRLEEPFAAACERMPALANAGIKRVVNGPMIFSPDLGPMLGPHPSLKNYFCAVGVMTGFNQAGGIGKSMAEWIIEGEPELDLGFWDVARFGKWAGKRFTFERTKYYYENREERPYPHRECPVGRSMRTFPTYDRQKALGAVFGMSNGWETPLWYALDADDDHDIYSFGRQNWFERVANECRHTRENAGLFDISTFAKYRLRGAGARAALERLLAGRIPARDGRMTLCPMLSHKGKLIGDFTVGKLGDDDYVIFGAGSMNGIHMRWFRDQLPKDVTLIDFSETWGGLMVCGPKAKEIVADALCVATDADMSFMQIAQCEFGAAPETLTLRVSFTGEFGYEIYMPMAYQRQLFDDLLARGQAHSLRPVGGRALMDMRLEKSFPSWGLELTSDYGPAETGMDRFVDWSREGFIGQEAALAARAAAPQEAITTLVVDGSDIDCVGGEPVFRGGALVGYVSSGGYGHTVGESLALAYLHPDVISDGAEVEVEILGNLKKCTISTSCRYDPHGLRLRGR